MLNVNIPYGAFMLGFDFHLTEEGPKLIEINTNAGGLATVFTFSVTGEDENGPRRSLERKHITNKFLKAINDEYQIAHDFIASHHPTTLPTTLTTVAIVDDDVTTQGLYPEMLEFQRIMEESGIQAFVLSPEDLRFDETEEALFYNSTRIDFVYNRLTGDFRLRIEPYQAIRKASLAGQLVVSPHPAAYVRIADKRNLTIITEKLNALKEAPDAPIYSTIVPETLSMMNKSMEEWIKERKKWVFKPPEGNGSRGVYRGDKVSASKLKSLPRETTLAQQYCPPSLSEDGTKLDFRVFTRDNDVLGLATRHFTGQVMEMRSAKSGFKMALPESVCCFCMLHDTPEMCLEFCRSDTCN